MNIYTGDRCSSLHELADVFMDKALNEKDLAAFLRHLDECPELVDVVAKRTALRIRMREVVRTAVAPEALDKRIRLHLTSGNSNRHQGWVALAIAAVVFLTLSLALSWREGGLRFTPALQENYIASLAPDVSPVMQIGLKQHVHCAVFRKRPAQFPKLEDLARGLEPKFAGLVLAMQRHLPGDFRVVEAHICSYQGRAYTHFIATNGPGLISMLVTNRAQGEALESDLRAVAAEAGENLYAASAQRFSVAGFETRSHFVYLVSDLGSKQNLATFRAMAPEVASTIRTLEI